MVAVTYHCPHCGAVAELERDAYLADRSVTEEPLDGWEYVPAYEDRETDRREVSDRASGERSDPRDADGIELVCGASETVGGGCGELYYLSFVKYEERAVPKAPHQAGEAGDGEELEPPKSLEDEPRFDFL